MKTSNIQKTSKLALSKPINNSCDEIDKDEKVIFFYNRYKKGILGRVIKNRIYRLRERAQCA